MKLNFHDIFQQYSTAKLLAILQQPEQYQPEAVAAADNILQERIISPEDRQEAESLINSPATAPSPLAGKLHALGEKTGSLLDPLLHPQEAVPAQKWLNILLLLMALQYGWVIYRAVQSLRYWWEVDGESVDVSLLFTVLNLAYIPLLFYGLLKKRRWGWILLYADNIFTLTGQVYQLQILLRFPDDYEANTSQLLLLMLIRAAFILFLGRIRIRNLFRISVRTRLSTALLSVLAALLYLLALEWI